MVLIIVSIFVLIIIATVSIIYYAFFVIPKHQNFDNDIVAKYCSIYNRVYKCSHGFYEMRSSYIYGLGPTYAYKSQLGSFSFGCGGNYILSGTLSPCKLLRFLNVTCNEPKNLCK